VTILKFLGQQKHSTAWAATKSKYGEGGGQKAHTAHTAMVRELLMLGDIGHSDMLVPKLLREQILLEGTTRYDHGFLCNQVFVVAKGESVDPLVDQESCKVAAPLEERPAGLKVGTRSCRDGPRSKIDCLQ
jgi:hypothetical protein